MKFGGQKFWFSTNIETGDPNLGGEGTTEVKLTRLGNGVAAGTLGRRKEQGNGKWKHRSGPEEQKPVAGEEQLWERGPAEEHSEDSSSSGSESLEERNSQPPRALPPG